MVAGNVTGSPGPLCLQMVCLPCQSASLKLQLQTQRLHADSVASDLAQNAHLSQLSPAPAFEPPSPLAGPSAALAHLPPIGSTGGLPMESSTRGVKTGTSKMDGGFPVGFSLNQPEKDALHKTPK